MELRVTFQRATQEERDPSPTHLFCRGKRSENTLTRHSELPLLYEGTCAWEHEELGEKSFKKRNKGACGKSNDNSPTG